MIRPLKQTDYTAAKRLFYDAFELSEDPYFKKAWRKRDPEATLGIWSGGALIGAAIVSNNCLNYIYIHASHRGGGTGTALLQAVLSVCPNIYLTPVNDPDVYRWYVKNGFHLSSIEGDIRIYVRHRHNLRERHPALNYESIRGAHIRAGICVETLRMPNRVLNEEYPRVPGE